MSAATSIAIRYHVCCSSADPRIARRPPGTLQFGCHRAQLEAHGLHASAAHSRSNVLALPPRIFSLSSLLIGAPSIHFVPSAFEMNGQSTENRMRSGPISMIEHNSAVLEKLPLVVR